MGCNEVKHNAPRANCNNVVEEDLVARLKWFGRAQKEHKKTNNAATNGTQVSSSPLLLSALASLGSSLRYYHAASVVLCTRPLADSNNIMQR
eukprot:SAG11_NODE_2577_length_3200_cov_30.456304_4_plen_92_part_00